jgi:hypothetical protein
MRRSVLAGLLAVMVLRAHADNPPSVDLASLQGERPPAGAIWVESIGLDTMQQRRERPRPGRSVRDLPIRLGGMTFPHGIGTRSISELQIDLHGAATRFVSMIGLDDVVKAGVGSVNFEVSGLI